jgi:hypothetical protein
VEKEYMFFALTAWIAATMICGVFLFSGSVAAVLPYSIIAGFMGVMCAFLLLKLVDTNGREQLAVPTKNQIQSTP